MKLKITIADVETGAEEDVLAGLVVAKRWEEMTGESVAAKLETNTPTVVVGLARLAFNRKHGKSLTIEEFEDRFDVEEIDSSEAKKAAPNPSVPATAQ